MSNDYHNHHAVSKGMAEDKTNDRQIIGVGVCGRHVTKHGHPGTSQPDKVQDGTIMKQDNKEQGATDNRTDYRAINARYVRKSDIGP